MSSKNYKQAASMCGSYMGYGTTRNRIGYYRSTNKEKDYFVDKGERTRQTTSDSYKKARMKQVSNNHTHVVQNGREHVGCCTPSQSFALPVLYEMVIHPFTLEGSLGAATEVEVVANLELLPLIGSSFLRISLKTAVLGCQSLNWARNSSNSRPKSSWQRGSEMRPRRAQGI